MSYSQKILFATARLNTIVARWIRYLDTGGRAACRRQGHLGGIQFLQCLNVAYHIIFEGLRWLFKIYGVYSKGEQERLESLHTGILVLLPKWTRSIRQKEMSLRLPK